MEDRINQTDLSPEALATAETACQNLGDSVEAFGVPLSKDERGAQHTPREGADPMFGLMSDVCTEFVIQVPGVSPVEMLADWRAGRETEAMAQRLEAMQQLLEDTSRVAQAEAWEAFLALWAVVKAMARRNPALAARIKPIYEFMKVKSVRKSRRSPEAGRTAGAEGQAEAGPAA